jgi:Killing trait
MAIPTPLNGVITDAVSQVYVTVLGSGPAAAAMTLSQVSAQAVGLMMQNASTAQQQLNMIAQAATAQSIARLADSSSTMVKSSS